MLQLGVAEAQHANDDTTLFLTLAAAYDVRICAKVRNSWLRVIIFNQFICNSNTVHERAAIIMNGRAFNFTATACNLALKQSIVRSLVGALVERCVRSVTAAGEQNLGHDAIESRASINNGESVHLSIVY